ncbi:MAG TPA: hypothetical protein VNA25_19445 [Phycisphaerae bacterium]|nr:hypothetical protein [Phycisphaerae bacterium]
MFILSPDPAPAQNCEPDIVSCNYGKYYSGTVTWTSLIEINTPNLKHSGRSQITATIIDGKVICSGYNSINREDRTGRYTEEGPVSGSGFLVVEKPFASSTDRSGKYLISVWSPSAATKWSNVPKVDGYGPPTSGTIPAEPASWRGHEADEIIYEHDTEDFSLLAGTETYEHPEADAANHVTGTVTITWNLSMPEELILIVRPQGYDAWRPEPGPDENSPGPRLLPVGFELFGKGKSAPKRKVDHFELELRDTSREPGIALNMPLVPAAVSGPDLRIAAESVPPGDEGQAASVSSPDGRTGSAAIAAYDGGGWSTLVVTAVLDSGVRVQGHLEKPEGPSEILLPKREPGSKIARSWLVANGNSADNADDEKTPGNAYDGDGFSVYEEYRGLVMKGQWRTLDPRQKELLVEVEKTGGFAAAARTGFNLFERASRIKVLALDPGELAEDRVVNRNAGNAHLLSQHALRLEQGNLPAGEAGENQPVVQKGKTPKDSQRVVIDAAQIHDHVIAQSAAASAAHVPMSYSEGDYLAETIAHEIAHGAGVDHHGPSSDQPNRVVERQHTNFRIFGFDGRLNLTRPFPIEGRVGSQGGESSGDLGCLMAYTDMYQWAYASEGGLNIFRALPLLPLGNRFCTSAAGTGINAATPGPSFFGDATWGNCAAKLRVRD